jgi:tetraacyldisaccharide 4'-kinase
LQRIALSHTTYLDLVSGRVPGFPGSAARAALTVLSWPYAGVVRLRNYLYSSGRLKVEKVSARVISVGNLTTGGTGKTPLVIWLCRLLQARHLRCVILTRGYKMPHGELSDEPAVLAAQCPEVPVIVDPNRVAGAAAAICRHNAQVLVLDDGFQHRRLARDLDIVALDASLPFGYGKVLPAGLLREPLAGLTRADAVVLTRCDQVSEETLHQIEQAVRRVNGHLALVRSVHAPAALLTAEGREIALAEMAGKSIFAFCGLGNPQSFFHTLEHLGGKLVETRVFADHYRYTPDDLTGIRRQAAGRQAELILTTQKDWTKIARLPLPPEHPPLAYLTVELQIPAGAPELIALIDSALGDRMAHL